MPGVEECLPGAEWVMPWSQRNLPYFLQRNGLKVAACLGSRNLGANQGGSRWELRPHRLVDSREEEDSQGGPASCPTQGPTSTSRKATGGGLQAASCVSPSKWSLEVLSGPRDPL